MNSKKLLFRSSKCLFSLFLLMGFSYNVFAQQGIIVKAESGTTTSVSFQDVYKLNFVNETMTVVNAAGVSGQSFILATTKGFSVGNVSVSALKEQINPNLKIYPTYTRQNIMIDGATEGSKAGIYAITGAKVMDVIIRSSNENINVGQLKSGMYMIRVNSQSFKFNKQ